MKISVSISRVPRIVRPFSVDTDSLKQSIVNASILHIKTEGIYRLNQGFTQTAIARGCDDLDLSPASSRLLDNGPIALINYLNIHWNKSFPVDIDKVVTQE